MGVARITLANELAELGRASAFLDEFGREHSLPRPLMHDLQVAVDEVLSNIVKYAYSDKQPHTIEVALAIEADHVVLTISDDGDPYDPLATPMPTPYLPDGRRRIGGVGMHFVRTLMDSAHYTRCGAVNQLVLRRRIGKST